MQRDERGRTAGGPGRREGLRESAARYRRGDVAGRLGLGAGVGRLVERFDTEAFADFSAK